MKPAALGEARELREQCVKGGVHLTHGRLHQKLHLACRLLQHLSLLKLANEQSQCC